MYQILKHSISFVVGEPRETNSTCLAAVRLVNSHWNDATRSLLKHRQIILTRVGQLNRLTQTGDRIPHIVRSQIVHLSVSGDLLVDALQARSDLDRTAAARLITTTLLDLISNLPSLDSLCIHSEYTLPLFSSPCDIIGSPHLNALITIPHLRITGVPDIRWPTDAGTNQSWRSSLGDISSPMLKYEATQLAEREGASLSWTNSDTQPCSSPPLRTTCIRLLSLVNASPIFTSTHFQSFLSSVSGTLETLTISSSKPGELDFITQALTQTLPRMPCLTHLSTNAYQLQALSPALHTLHISLDANPSFCSTPTLPPTNIFTSLPVGTIFHTISGILDSISSCTAPPPSMPSLPPRKPTLKDFVIADASTEDFLHFNLSAAEDWGGPTAAAQHRLWMKASELGVLIEVKRRQQ